MEYSGFGNVGAGSVGLEALMLAWAPLYTFSGSSIRRSGLEVPGFGEMAGGLGLEPSVTGTYSASFARGSGLGLDWLISHHFILKIKKIYNGMLCTRYNGIFIM